MARRPLELRAMKSPLAAPVSGAWRVELDAPARSVMTDFTEHSMITVINSLNVDAALEHMKHAGTRSAFVIDDRDGTVLGLVTAYDIMGEKPMMHMQLQGGTRADVTVEDIMDPVTEWHVAAFADLATATVESILATFQAIGRTHLAVVEDTPGGPRLRGVFSSAKLLRLTELSRAKRLRKAA
jgi:CBS domain containing-hemolysin-like protein